jgi:hypothetical protein
MPAAVFLAFAVTALVVTIILLTRRLHDRVTEDHLYGPQKSFTSARRRESADSLYSSV